MMLDNEYNAHYRTLDPLATLVQLVSDCLVRNIHTSGLPEVIL